MSTPKFPWLKVDPTTLKLTKEPPLNMSELRNRGESWRILLQDWLVEAHPDQVSMLPLTLNPNPSGDVQMDKSREEWATYFTDNYLASGGEFHTEVQRLRRALAEDPKGLSVTGKQAAQDFELSERGRLIRVNDDALFEAYGVIESAKRELIKESDRVGSSFEAIPAKAWKTRDKAISELTTPRGVGGATIEGVTALSFQKAEGKLREAADRCRTSDASDKDWGLFDVALQDFVRATVAVGMGLAKAAELLWDSAVEHAKEQIKENFANEAPEVAQGLLAAKTGVFISGGIITALAPVPVVGQVLAGIGIGLAVAMSIAQKITIETVTNKMLEDPKMVKKFVGKKYGEESGIKERLEKVSEYADKAQFYSDSLAFASDTLSKVEAIGEHGRHVLEVGAKAEAAVAMFTGPIISQAGLMLDFYNTGPKELGQYLSDQEVEVLAQAVEWAEEYREYQGRGKGKGTVVIHGPDSGGLRMTIAGIPGVMSPEGRFSQDDPQVAFMKAIAAGKREDETRLTNDTHPLHSQPYINWPDPPEFLGFTENDEFRTSVTFQNANGFYTAELIVGADGALTFPESLPQFDAVSGKSNDLNPWEKSDEELLTTSPFHSPPDAIDDSGVDWEYFKENDPQLYYELVREWTQGNKDVQGVIDGKQSSAPREYTEDPHRY